VPKQQEPEKEVTKYHKQSVVEVANKKEEEDIKEIVRKLDRSGQNNLFGKY
jgi:hypothetical protein